MKKIIASVLAVLAFSATFAQSGNLPTTDNGNQHTNQPVINLIVGTSGDYIHVDSLQYLSSDFLITKNSRLLDGYEVISAVVVIVPKKGELISMQITGNKLTPVALEKIRTMKAEDKLLLDNIKAKNTASGESRNIMPAIYTIINADTRLHLAVSGFAHTQNLTFKGLKLLDETITVKEDSCELKSFTITITPLSDKTKAKRYDIKGNTLTPEILQEIKSCSVPVTITLENVSVFTNQNIYRNLEPTTYTISD